MVFAKWLSACCYADNLGTFGHMITKAYELLQQDPPALSTERAKARFILVDEFQDANFAQVKVLAALAGDEHNVFAVGDPDDVHSTTFAERPVRRSDCSQRHFPGARLVVLEKNQRSLSPILQCAFALIHRNPPVFTPGGPGGKLNYKRTPLQSAREEKACEEGKPLSGVPVEIVPRSGRISKPPTSWPSFRNSGGCYVAVGRTLLFFTARIFIATKSPRNWSRREFRFRSRTWTCWIHPGRDLLACLGAVDSTADAASLLRVAALPQFQIDPEHFRAALRGIPRDSPQGHPTTLAALLVQVEGGPAVLTTLRRVRDEMTAAGATTSGALEMVIRTFRFDRTSPLLRAVLKPVDDWEGKPLTKTGGVGEFLEYMRFFREARGSGLPAIRRTGRGTANDRPFGEGARVAHVFVIRAASGSFRRRSRSPLSIFRRRFGISIPHQKSTARRSMTRKSVACSTLR